MEKENTVKKSGTLRKQIRLLRQKLMTIREQNTQDSSLKYFVSPF